MGNLGLCLPWSVQAFLQQPFLWAHTVLINLPLPFFKTLTWFPLLTTRPHVICLPPASPPSSCPSFPPASVACAAKCPPTSTLPSLMLVLAQSTWHPATECISQPPPNPGVTVWPSFHAWEVKSDACHLRFLSYMKGGMCIPVPLPEAWRIDTTIKQLWTQTRWQSHAPSPGPLAVLHKGKQASRLFKRLSFGGLYVKC